MGELHLSIATPEQTIVDVAGVRAIRAMDDSGSFGLLPGHVDLLTVLPATVVRWRGSDDQLCYCAVRSGVLTMTGGTQVAIACRQALRGDRLEDLEADILAARAAETDADKRARIAQTQLHARAVRQLMRYLVPGEADPLQTGLEEGAP